MVRHHDIFISYRRDGGQATALLLYETLSRAGYRVAYDIETLLAGEFAPKIMETIEHCKDVLVVLGPGALDRCADSGDLVRREIAKALVSPCRVIPVLLAGFSFPPPADMPGDIRALAGRNGVAASMPHFDSTVAQIVRRLASKPRWYRRRASWAAIAAAALLTAAALPAALRPAVRARDYPSTRQELQDANRVLSGLVRLSSACNAAQGHIDDLLGAAAHAIGGDRTAFDELIPFFANRMRAPIREIGQSAPADTFLETLRASPIPLEIYAGLAPARLDAFVAAQTRLPDELERLLASPLAPARKEEWRTLKAEWHSLAADAYALAVMDLLRGFAPESVREFRQTSALWSSLPRFYRGEWLRDPERIAIESRAVLERRNAIADRLAAIAGNLGLAAAADARAGEDALVREGIPPEDAARIAAKTARKTALEAAIADTELEIGTARQRLWLSKGATEEDEDGLLWDKARFFLAHGQPADAIEALEILARRPPSPDYPPGAVASFTALCRLAPALPFTNGMMAVNFEPPATSHAVFRPGDVVTARNGTPVLCFDDLLPTQPGTAYTLWRPAPDGTFTALEATLPDSQPRTAWVPVFPSTASSD